MVFKCWADQEQLKSVSGCGSVKYREMEIINNTQTNTQRYKQTHTYEIECQTEYELIPQQCKTISLAMPASGVAKGDNKYKKMYCFSHRTFVVFLTFCHLF